MWGSLQSNAIFSSVVKGWREKVRGERDINEGKQKVVLHTMPQLLRKSGTFLHECDTLVCRCDTSLHE